MPTTYQTLLHYSDWGLDELLRLANLLTDGNKPQRASRLAQFLDKRHYNGDFSHSDLLNFIDPNYMITQLRADDTVYFEMNDEGINRFKRQFDRIAQLRKPGKVLAIQFMYDSPDHVNFEVIHRELKNETLRAVEHAVHGLRDDTDIDDFTSSEYAYLQAFEHCTDIKLRWVPLDILPEDVAFFPFLNKTGVDASFASIFEDIDERNYTDNCFFNSLVQSGEFTTEQLEQIRLANQSRYVNEFDIRTIADTFQKHIVIHKVDVDGSKTQPLSYGPSDGPEIKLLIRFNHCMLYKNVPCELAYLEHKAVIDANPRINQKRKHFIRKFNVKTNSFEYAKSEKGMDLNKFIDKALELNLFIPFRSFEQDIANRFMNHVPCFDTLDYSPESVRPYKAYVHDNRYSSYIIAPDPSSIPPTPNKIIFYNDLETVLPNVPSTANVFRHRSNLRCITLPKSSLRSMKAIYPGFDGTNDEFVTYIDFMSKVCGFPIWQYESLASIAVHYANVNHCYDGVYETSGIVTAFIQKCSPGPTVRNIANDYKVDSDIIDIDINSSYGSAITSLGGIPKGKPKPFGSQMFEGHDVPKPFTSTPPQHADVWFAQIDIKDYHSRFEHDTFPLLHQTGRIFTNSVMFATIQKYYDVQYEFINGYYFDEGLNTNICKVVQRLYNLRRQHPQYSKVFKFFISTLFGRSLFCESAIKTITCTEPELEKTLAKCGGRLHGYTRRAYGKYNVQYLKSFNFSYCIPHFGGLILSQGKSSIYNIAYGILHGQNVYRINTDSIIMDKTVFDQHNIIQFVGDNLGQFKIEWEAHSLYLINTSSFVAFTDSEPVARGVAARKYLQK